MLTTVNVSIFWAGFILPQKHPSVIPEWLTFKVCQNTLSDTNHYLNSRQDHIEPIGIQNSDFVDESFF